jgi:hypothetical protein
MATPMAPTSPKVPGTNGPPTSPKVPGTNGSPTSPKVPGTNGDVVVVDKFDKKVKKDIGLSHIQ